MYWLFTLVIVWLTGSCSLLLLALTPHHWESILLHITSLGKDQNSKLEIFSVYSPECISLLHHYKVNNFKSSHCKSGTICTSFDKQLLLGLFSISSIYNVLDPFKVILKTTKQNIIQLMFHLSLHR